jgi:ferric-dicitrate binding protein FerR (iron transport regulator)
VLQPNEKLTFTKNNGQFTKSTLSDVDKDISWVTGQLAFDRERLEDIAKILERMYSIRIRFASENLKDIRFSGTLKNNNLENVLQLITFVSPVRYSLENDTTFVIQNKSLSKK